MENTQQILQDYLPQALWETFYMVGVSTIIGVLLGTAIGLALFLLNNELFAANRVIHQMADFVVNAIRSLPFLILLVTLIPLITLLIGDPYTPTGGAIALSVAAVPFFARIAESSFAEIDAGVLEASIATGAKTRQIVFAVILPESLPGLIRGVVLTIISLLGYSAMVGTIGAGGIGDLALQYGYYRYETVVLVAVIVLLVIIVQIIQWLGDRCASYFTKT
ncbi:ABC transporter permease [Tetragenococcus halophilus]|uniref:ABC transporter permease n=1 Tax=Tetragenococcus halophilus TaxID=51669 RepID=A0A3G5FKB3_TETHA|nr:methionine ABC transporter permease [Tetragenococcus halophilus]AYW50711.1 ABC transporter permease [Tetragenococcus halophilus]MCF1684359.1 ABC transporter permease [Tetragenococcus halophilus]GBD64968.1 D-methionine transport system permease metI [Tetragenococcus halophilus subsp. flandriensis]